MLPILGSRCQCFAEFTGSRARNKRSARQLRECIFAPARRVLAHETLPAAFAACEVVPSTLKKSIGDVASLMAALAQQK
jgi:hypothetical protein